MLFKYTAQDKSGKEVNGTIEAESKLKAADKLFNENQLSVISIDKVNEKEESAKTAEKKPVETKKEKSPAEKGKKPGIHIGKSKIQDLVNKVRPEGKKIKSIADAFNAANEWLIMQSKIKAKDKSILFRLLAVMINAGMPILKSLKIMSKQSKNPRMQSIIKDVAESVERGSKFSDALASHEDIFTEAEVGIIAAGEASGQLNKTLSNLAEETEKGAKLKSKVKSAMIYPIAVITILIGAIILVMVKVVPNLQELFTSSGVELPLSTRVLIGGSDFFNASWLIVPNWMLFILVVIGIIFLIKSWRKTKHGAFIWDKLMLKMPIFGVLNTKVALGAFARQLSLLSGSGVSIIRSLEITAHAVGNEVYKKRLLEVREDVEKGISIHKAIEDDPLFPGMVASMIAVGEQTAQLGTVSGKIADFYDDEVATFVKNLSTIMEPAIIVFIGAMVAGLVAAIMQPIMEISDIASKI